MRIRVAGLLAILLLLAAGCGGDDDVSGTTPATGSETTGATGSAEIARFAVVVQDVEGGNTLSFSGESCVGIDGPYEVIIAVEGNVTGQTTASFAFNGEGTSTLEWSLDATGADGDTTLSGRYAVQISPQQESQVIVFTGVTTVKAASGDRTFNVATDDVTVDEGTGACTSNA